MCRMGSGRRERHLRGAAGAPCAWCLQLPSPDTGTCREPPETRLDWPRQRTVPAAAPLPRVTRRTGPVTAAPATAGPCDGPGHLHVTRAPTETQTARSKPSTRGRTLGGRAPSRTHLGSPRCSTFTTQSDRNPNDTKIERQTAEGNREFGDRITPLRDFRKDLGETRRVQESSQHTVLEEPYAISGKRNSEFSLV